MKEIMPKELEAKLNEGVHIIDVREVDEVKEGKIPGAIHIPLDYWSSACMSSTVRKSTPWYADQADEAVVRVSFSTVTDTA